MWHTALQDRATGRLTSCATWQTRADAEAALRLARNLTQHTGRYDAVCWQGPLVTAEIYGIRPDDEPDVMLYTAAQHVYDPSRGDWVCRACDKVTDYCECE